MTTVYYLYNDDTRRFHNRAFLDPQMAERELSSLPGYGLCWSMLDGPIGKHLRFVRYHDIYDFDGERSDITYDKDEVYARVSDLFEREVAFLAAKDLFEKFGVKYTESYAPGKEFIQNDASFPIKYRNRDEVDLVLLQRCSIEKIRVVRSGKEDTV